MRIEITHDVYIGKKVKKVGDIVDVDKRLGSEIVWTGKAKLAKAEVTPPASEEPKKEKKVTKEEKGK